MRFAPSPTGHLHVGGARTALYNWLYARSQGGAFILRIEDTDISRSTDENIRKITDSLRWLGIDWDEGPEKGGEAGPYRQMERLDLYGRVARNLLEAGKAYNCYCTTNEIESARESSRKEGRPHVYNGRCRSQSPEEEQRLIEEGRRPVLRLKTPDRGKTQVNDLIRGKVVFDNALLGDFIMVRSSGVPTYNFAVAVDDANMEISHVIRGDDHLPNTPKQLLVFQAIEAEAPQYAHLPLILGPDRAPLSKRHGSVSIEEFRDRGYVREALCNYLALLGWSYDAETTLFGIDDLIDKFSLERVGSTAAVFDRDKLTWMNGHYLRDMNTEELSARLREYLKGSRLAALAGTGGRPALEELVPLVQEKIKTLADFTGITEFFFLPVEFEPESLRKLKEGDRSLDILKEAELIIREIGDYKTGAIETALRQAADGMGLKLGKFLQPVRIAVSGKTVTPGMFETLAVLGNEESRKRIAAAIDLLEA